MKEASDYIIYEVEGDDEYDIWQHPNEYMIQRHKKTGIYGLGMSAKRLTIYFEPDEWLRFQTVVAEIQLPVSTTKVGHEVELHKDTLATFTTDGKVVTWYTDRLVAIGWSIEGWQEFQKMVLAQMLQTM